MSAQATTHERPPASEKTKRTTILIFGTSLSTIVRYLALCLLTMVFAGPLLWMIALSVKPDTELQQIPPQLFPSRVVWENYYTALYVYHPMIDFNRIAINTLVYVGLATLGMLLSTSIVAYGFARIPFKGSTLLFPLVLATLMLPSQVTLIPQFLLFNQLGWLDSLKPLIVPAWFGGVGGAFYIFLFRQFFMTIPKEIDEAAVIDGASHLDILFRIVVPLSVPAFITCTALSLVERWNDFFGPLIYANSMDQTVIAVFLTFFSVKNQNAVPVNMLMAAATVSVVPVILFFLVLQDYFVQGVTMTGLKEG